MTSWRVGVIGGGLMGSGIAEVCAKAGHQVLIHEISPEAAEAAQARVQQSLAKGVERGKLEPALADQTAARIAYSTDIADQADREIVIEAVTENETLKSKIFRDLDNVVTEPNAILASNTSSIPITRLASVTNRPDHVVGLHFFNPVPVMALVELIGTVKTDPLVLDRANQFVVGLGKTVIKAKDRAGFIVNMLLVPYVLGAIRMLEAGVATREDIDAGMKLGASHPMGPLELSDFVGLDTMKLVADVLFDEFKEALYASAQMLNGMVEAGLLGRKTGEGFYNYG